MPVAMARTRLVGWASPATRLTATRARQAIPEEPAIPEGRPTLGHLVTGPFRATACHPSTVPRTGCPAGPGRHTGPATGRRARPPHTAIRQDRPTPVRRATRAVRLTRVDQ